MALYRGTSITPELVSRTNPPLPPGAEPVSLDGARPAPREGRSLAAQPGTPAGPGAEMKAVLGLLGFQSGGCGGGCNALADRMDAWGPSGCRRNAAEILARLREQKARLGWWQTVKAGAAAVREGLPLTVEGLLDEAIRRAEARAAGAVRPSRITRVEGLTKGEAGAAFNASLFRRHGELLLAYRTGWAGARIHVARMTEELAVRSSVTLRLDHPRATHGQEDPKAFEHDGSLWLSFIGVRGRNGRMVDTHQLLARLHDDLTVAEVVYPHYDKRLPWEKNHQYVSYQDDPLNPPVLYAVYTIHPHVLLRVDGDAATEVHRHDWTPRWSGGALRGGAHPVLVPEAGERWAFFHGKEEPRTTYSIGVIAYDADPPFLPRRMTPDPICRADPATKPPDQYCPVVFAGGAVKDGDRWLVSAGVHDRWSAVYEFSHEGIEKALVTL